MRAPYLLPLLLLVPAASLSQPATPVVDVRLTSFDFTPSRIRLRAGQPVVLRLTNPGRGGHDFSAPEFFAAATLAPGQHHVFHHAGGIEVPGHRTVTVLLTPARGNYRLKCTHTLHSFFGMKGRIIVA